MRVIKRVGVLSLAKFMGMSAAALGLVFGLIYGLVILCMTLVGAAGILGSGGDNALLGGGAGLGMGVVMALGAVVMIPLFYGFFAFFFGFLYGVIINMALRLSGGIEFEVADAG